MVSQLIGKGHEVVFITATPLKVRAHRGLNLFTDFPGISGVVCVPPGSNDKSLVRCNLYVDDKPEVITHMVSLGREAVLVGRPWNTHVKQGVVRVTNWEQLLHLVEEM
jgi:hypothetical protein